MDTLSNTTFLKRMGILDIIAAIFLVIMGALLLNVEFNAEFGGSWRKTLWFYNEYTNVL